jgi:hypothetical protein
MYYINIWFLLVRPVKCKKFNRGIKSLPLHVSTVVHVLSVTAQGGSYKGSALTSDRTRCVSVKKTSNLMLFSLRIILNY